MPARPAWAPTSGRCGTAGWACGPPSGCATPSAGTPASCTATPTTAPPWPAARPTTTPGRGWPDGDRPPRRRRPEACPRAAHHRDGDRGPAAARHRGALRRQGAPLDGPPRAAARGVAAAHRPPGHEPAQGGAPRRRVLVRVPGKADLMRPPQAGPRGLARLGPGDLLAALGELAPGRVAEAYAELGYRVVPMHATRGDGGCTCRRGARCPDPGKHPCLAGWPRLASTTPAEVRRWWRRWPLANVGLATGARFDVLDLDGPQGVEALRAALSQRHPAEHPGPVARSGGGGWHLLYAATGLGNRVGLLPGVDWRGRGGLVVAPPSRHASGQPYRWVRPLAGGLPSVPAALRARLDPPAVARTSGPPAAVAGGRAERYARSALAREAHAVASAPAGTCNDTLNRAAFNLGQLTATGLLDPGEVRAVLLEAALAAPATGHRDRERRARATIASGLRAGARTPRTPGRGVA